MSNRPHAVLRPLPGTVTLHPRGELIPVDQRLWMWVAGPWYDDSIGHDDCWFWFGKSVGGKWKTTCDGDRRRIQGGHIYGKIHSPTPDNPRRLVFAHRAAYEAINGPIPEDLLIRHTCDHTLCCNPAHHVPGTNAENSADVARGGRLKGHNQHTRRRAMQEAVA